MNFLAIDGGVHHSAVALFHAWGGTIRLADVAFVRAGATVAPAGVDLVVVERPQIDGRSPRPQDIVDLAWASAALAYSYGVPVHAVEPRTWKGSVPKPVHHARVLVRPQDYQITPAEREVLDTCVGPDWGTRIAMAADKVARNPGKYPGAAAYGSWTGHNLLDAVCLGLWAWERFTKGTLT